MSRYDIRWRMADTLADYIIVAGACVVIVLMMTGAL
jgi:hypothetical protein